MIILFKKKCIFHRQVSRKTDMDFFTKEKKIPQKISKFIHKCSVTITIISSFEVKSKSFLNVIRK